MRRFRLEDTVQDVEAFLLSKGIDPDTHLLAKQFPRKVLPPFPGLELGLCLGTSRMIA